MRYSMKLFLAAAVLASTFSTITEAKAVKSPEYPNLRLPVSTNMPVGSIYYDYLDKLDGMGYVKSMLYGARPYSRVDMARWTQEARAKTQSKDTPAYIEQMIRDLEKELAPEIAAWDEYEAASGTTGNAAGTTGSGTYNSGLSTGSGTSASGTTVDRKPGGNGAPLKFHEFSVSAVYSQNNKDSYNYNGPSTASYEPFSTYNNGHHYGNGGNFTLGTYLSGNLGREVALSLSPRLDYTSNDKFSGSLDEAYLASRIGIFKIEVGKQALDFGQGYTGKLGLSNNGRPLTMFKVATEERPRNHGLLAFLGKTRWTGFIGRLDGERDDNNVHDFNHPYLVGMRSDFIYDNLNIGMERLSLLGGDGNAFKFSDTWDWVRGKNAYSHDKWDDIAGIDLKYRFPGLQIYGELYGEDQANYLPSDVAYRGGHYFPQLTRDGRWDLRLEAAHTNNDWYVHGTYQAGWTYHHDIMGDAMGKGATKYYAGINHYLSAKDTIGLNGQYEQMGEAYGVRPKVGQIWLSYTRRLNGSDRLGAVLGLAALKNINFNSGEDKTDKFVKLTWTRAF